MCDLIFTTFDKNRIAFFLSVAYNLINVIAEGYKMDFNDLNPELNELYSKLNDIGCCKICCLRFLGETCPEPFKCLNTQLKVGKLLKLIK